MELLQQACQLVIALGLLNVWLLRRGKSTGWRGGRAKTMREEFAVYGLPNWAMVLVGVTKVYLAALLLAGLWIPAIAAPAALGLAILMLGAVAMHVKVGDPAKKALPALALFLLCLVVVLL